MPMAPVFESTGTWTPVLTFATPGDLNVVYSNQLGTYIRIGSMVQVVFFVTTSTFTHATASGILELTGLPFTAATIGINCYGGMDCSGITKAGYTDFAAVVESAVAYVTFRASGSGVAASSVTAANMPTGGTVRLVGSVNYRAV